MSPPIAGVKDPAQAALRRGRVSTNWRRREEADYVWAAHYGARHDAASRREREERARRRIRDRLRGSDLGRVEAARQTVEAAGWRLRARFEAEVLPHAPDANYWRYVRARARAGDADARIVHRADCEPVWRETRAARAADVARQVRDRIERGFLWKGGAVGGNQGYQRERFVFRGLRSADFPILKLFVCKTNRARKGLLVGDDKAGAHEAERKLLALDAPYVTVNRTMRGVLRVEVDGIATWAQIEAACSRKGLPPPNVCVGWVDPQGRVWNPHLIWLLDRSVPFTDAAQARFKRLFLGVLRGLNHALADLGADPAGMANAMRMKNPLSPLWDIRVMCEAPYDLDSLREHVDITVRRRALLASHAARRGEPVADHPDASVAAGSNGLFRGLAEWARAAVGGLRKAGVPEAEFAALVEQEAHRLASALTGDARRCERQARATAASVARWTWNTYRPRVAASRRVTADEADLRARQRASGVATASGRRSASGKAVVAGALALAAAGRRATQAAVREWTGLGRATVERCWAAAKAALASLRSEETDAAVVPSDGVVSDKRGRRRLAVAATSPEGHLSRDVLEPPPPCAPAAACQGRASSSPILGPVPLVLADHRNTAPHLPTARPTERKRQGRPGSLGPDGTPYESMRRGGNRSVVAADPAMDWSVSARVGGGGRAQDGGRRRSTSPVGDGAAGASSPRASWAPGLSLGGRAVKRGRQGSSRRWGRIVGPGGIKVRHPPRGRRPLVPRLVPCQAPAIR